MKRKVLLLSAFVLAICFVMTGCPSRDAGADRDTLNISTNMAMTTLDGHGSNFVQDKYIFYQIFEGLYAFNEALGRVEPRIALNHTVSDDGMVYTFNLRRDAYFHNGDRIRASDVVFSFLRAGRVPAIAAFSTNIVNAVALDDYTVEIHLSGPFAPFMVNITSIFIMSEREITEQGDRFGTQVHLAGSGPYFPTFFQPDQLISLQAFPQYWRGEADIRYVNFHVIADASAAVIALEAGELDWLSTNTTDFLALRGNRNFNSELMPANQVIWLTVNFEANEFLYNDLIRRAIGYSLDKEAMNLVAFDGLAFPADSLYHPDFNVGAPPVGNVVFNYNPQRARELLAEAGFPGGVDVGAIITWPGGVFEKLAIVAQANMAAVGIRSTLEWVEQGVSFVRARRHDFDMFMTGNVGSGDFDTFRRRFHSAQVGAFFVRLQSDKFDWQRMDQLMDESSATTDPERRVVLTAELNDMFMDTATHFPLLFQVNAFVWNRNLNVVNQPNYFHIFDWSWNR